METKKLQANLYKIELLSEVEKSLCNAAKNCKGPSTRFTLVCRVVSSKSLQVSCWL